MARKLQRPLQVGPQLQLRLQLLVVLLIVRIQLRITLLRRQVDTHGQRLDVAYGLQSDGLLLLGHGNVFGNFRGEYGARHLAFLVAQPVGTLPRCSPLRQRLTQVADALTHRIVLLIHQPEALDGQLAGFRQIAVDGNQRVHRCNVVKGLYTRQTGGLAVARLAVIAVQPLPLAELPADDVQQVVVIVHLTVLAVHHKRTVRLALRTGQRLRMLQGLLTIRLRLLPGVFVQMGGIVGIHLRQYGTVDGLQRHILGAFRFLFQSLQGWFQRVGSHLGLQARRQQRGLQQLTVVTRLLRLRLYLLQVFHSGFGQVLPLSLFHLFP